MVTEAADGTTEPRGESMKKTPGPSATKRRRRMIALIMVLFHVLGLVSSIHAIMTARTEQGAVAWAISLNTVPYVAVPAYWVLGRSNFDGYVETRRGTLARVAERQDFLARLPLFLHQKRMRPSRGGADDGLAFQERPEGYVGQHSLGGDENGRDALVQLERIDQQPAHDPRRDGIKVQPV